MLAFKINQCIAYFGGEFVLFCLGLLKSFVFVEGFWKQENIYIPDKCMNEIGEITTSKQFNPLNLQEKENE